MSKDLLRLYKHYCKLTPLERFKLSAEALARADDDELQWLRATSLETTYVGPEAAFRSLWEAVRRVVTIAYPTWVRLQTLLEVTAEAFHFVEMVHEQARDYASDYYCQGYKAARRHAARSEYESERAHTCVSENEAYHDLCNAPAERDMYEFSGLQKHESFIYRPAIDKLQTQFYVHLIGLKALNIALERLCDTHNITLHDLVAINPAFQYIIKESRDFLTIEIDESMTEQMSKCAEVYFGVLNASWNNDVNYLFSDTLGLIYGSKAAQMFLEWHERIRFAEKGKT